MADIWSGNIILPNKTIIRDVVLTSCSTALSLAIPSAALRFLTPVETARIPLYLAAGPSLDVWTTSEDTQAWFESVLLSTPTPNATASAAGIAQDWWSCPRSQSPIGILVQVEKSISDGQGPAITEVLFYGTITEIAKGGLPTPPSSSPDVLHPQYVALPELRVHALPLSSELLHQSHHVDIPPLSPARSANEATSSLEPTFLPSPFIPSVAPDGSPKRKRDIFEEVTQLRKKARRKGGEGVSAAAARAGETQPPISHRKSLSIDTKAAPFPDFRPASAGGVLSRPPSRLLSRSPSISSDVRPASRKGQADGPGKRSALSRVATVSVQPEEPTIETRNKEALSKVVMAAMRMHGLQQRKRSRSRRNSVAPGVAEQEPLSVQNETEDAVKDEEYKLLYHQTYKGAALAFRKHISTKPLHLQTDRLRDVVEKLLALFLTDPLAQFLHSDDSQHLLATPGTQKRLGLSGSSHSRASPFDLPSGNRSVPAKIITQQNTDSPTRKKGQWDEDLAS